MRKKKLLQINPVARTDTSTGRIMQEIGEMAVLHGWESHIAYSGGRDSLRPCRSEQILIGNKTDVVFHGLATRLLDRHGLASERATRAFVRRVQALAPDIIHLHNLHGYFLNYPLLFAYLRRTNIPVIWTIHDCWAFTGHCYYYSYAGCERWLTGCGHCVQRRDFPASWWRDRSARNYQDKRRAFTSLPVQRLTVVPVSRWMRAQMEQSFMSGYPLRVIRNGIDTDVFRPCPDGGLKRRLGVEGKHILLGVAAVWSAPKGIDDFLSLAPLLREDEVIVLVGTIRGRRLLPPNIINVERTADAGRLACLYAAATALLNLTYQDNYPTVNMEAIACGTPVITYATGGSAEAVTGETGFVVEQGDLLDVLWAVRSIERRGKAYYQSPCRAYAVSHFNKNDRYTDYIKLYDEMMKTSSTPPKF